MEQVLEKLQKILHLSSEEGKEKLRLEFSKMIPANANSIVTPKIGWGHHDDSVHVSIGFTVKPYLISDEQLNLTELYEQLINRLTQTDRDKLVESFEVILSENPEKVKLSNMPSLEIETQTKAIFTSFEISV